MGGLIDGFGREITHLRVSVTDLCNLRCTYCMPPEGVPRLPRAEVLTLEEIAEVVRVAVSLGVHKVRLTGGEPLVRKGVVDLVRMLAGLTGLRTLALTTNGTLLDRLARPLADAGLTRVNVSLDTVDPDLYARITRRGALSDALRGIAAAREAGLPVKLNAVLLPELLEHGRLEALVGWAAERDLELRFIERMPFTEEEGWVSEAEALRALPCTATRSPLAGHHVRGWACAAARLGFISPRSGSFCAGCDKLRLTSTGQLRPCLAAPVALDVRGVLRHEHTADEVAQVLSAAVAAKPERGPWEAPGAMSRVGG